MIKFSTPDISEREIANVIEKIKTGWLTNGPMVRKFENKIAEMSFCHRAVAFDSCTGAMEMTLRALEIGPGDEVITTPYTYSATAEVIRNVGAKIIFVDLDGESFEMDYKLLEKAITPKTKAVMPVDIGGKLCNYDAIRDAIDSQKELFTPSCLLQEAIGRPVIVADAAHSFKAKRGRLVCGELADFTCFSFHALKNITTGGEGGAVVWREIPNYPNCVLERKLRLMGDHGQTSRDKSKGWEYDIELFGYNSIMTDVDAAMGLAQLDRFDELLKKRTEVTKRYDELFEGVDFTKPLIQHIGASHTSAMHLYPIQLPKEVNRDEIYFKLRDAGVPCNVHYKPLPMMTAYKKLGYNIAYYQNAYEMFQRLLTIPYHTELTEEDQRHVVQEIGKAVRGG